MLTNPEQSAAKLARFDVEYTEQRFLMKKDDFDRNRTNIANMTLDSGFKGTNDFLDSLHVETKLPKKTRDIYFYLPFRMLGIMPTVAKFSDIDLMTGKTNRRPFFYKTNRFKDSGSLLNLASGVVFNKKSGMLKIGNQEVPIKEFLITAYDKKGKLTRQRQNIHKDGKMYLVYMRSYNTFLVLDEDMLNSTYIQLFVFENYDKSLFEPVILAPSAKVFKLKI
jgi:dolichyl-diphosphooligosaccharide--protein glycosyltransferase/undecaprenyl-diphosphooligosaccharide--protein glycosyltransferase